MSVCDAPSGKGLVLRREKLCASSELPVDMVGKTWRTMRPADKRRMNPERRLTRPIAVQTMTPLFQWFSLVIMTGV
jgi:hypothetical protein